MCFENDLGYVIFKYLLRRTAFYKVLRKKDLILLKIQIMMDTKEVLLHWFVKSTGTDKTNGGTIKSKVMPNQQLVNELHKPIIRTFTKFKVHSSFKDNSWSADLE